MALTLPLGPPAGFPKCPKCPYLKGGPARVCLDCASKSFEQVGGGCCAVCNQFLEADGSCPNWLCADPRRRITRIRAIAYSSGPLRLKIHAYKYDNKIGWGPIFGRIFLAWLQLHLAAGDVDLIVAHPSFVEPESGLVGHTERVIEAAAREDVRKLWPFDLSNPRAIVRVHATERSAGRSASAKRASARAFREALKVPDPNRTHGKRILVYDDLCTTASQLDAVAECLIDEGGATDVSAVVLARAPWRPRPRPAPSA